MKIYLAGPIAGCRDSEARFWRNYVQRLMPNYTYLDPMRRDYRADDITPHIVREIVLMDIQDIEAADIVLVNFSKPSVGTSMEILHAHMRDTPVVVHLEGVMPHAVSPWLMHYATRMFTEWEDVADWIDTYHALRP